MPCSDPGKRGAVDDCRLGMLPSILLPDYDSRPRPMRVSAYGIRYIFKRDAFSRRRVYRGFKAKFYLNRHVILKSFIRYMAESCATLRNHGGDDELVFRRQCDGEAAAAGA
ncbi:hypothetical protein DOFOFD_05610 [Acetobacteraceae bacterium EV16P]|uniref:Uncharacterized protein n=1 Tax=Sorlinia euscelidii TaxID=3081148 RepID=A0ABU7U2L7_9PROT